MAGTLSRWRPFAELEELRSRMDRMFEDALGEAREVRAEAGWTPAIDLQREDGKLIVRADVPGIKPEEIKVEVVDDLLTLSGQHEETEEEKGRDFVRRERRFGSFKRSIAIPPEVDPDAIEAVTHDGVLEVTVPLPEKEGASRKVITPKAA
jgi:HSP20 family protein